MKKLNIISLYIFIIVSFAALLKLRYANAQKVAKHNTGYYKDYPSSLSAGVNFSKKYALFTLPTASGNAPNFQYRLKYKI